MSEPVEEGHRHLGVVEHARPLVDGHVVSAVVKPRGCRPAAGLLFEPRPAGRSGTFSAVTIDIVLCTAEVHCLERQLVHIKAVNDDDVRDGQMHETRLLVDEPGCLGRR